MEDSIDYVATPMEAGRAALTAASLIDRARQTPEEAQFTVETKYGVLRFRLPADAADYFTLGVRAQQFAAKCSKTPPPAQWAAWLPLPPQVAAWAFWVAELALDPVISQIEALQIARECGPLLGYLFTSIMQQIGSQIGAAEMEAIQSLGETSVATPSGGPTSP